MLITPATISRRLDQAAPCLDPSTCDGTCEQEIYGSAYDAVTQFPAGVEIHAETTWPAFSAPFSTLTASSADGEELASVSRYWDIAEGLWDLLARVSDTAAVAQ
jgi:hypothetical protein